MEAIKMFEQYWEQLKRLGTYSQFCAEGDIHVAVCRDFWIWVAVGTMAFGLLIVGIIAKRLITEQLEFHRTKKRLEARKIVAAEEVMAAARWQGDALEGNLEELPAEELADKFRTAIVSEKSPSSLA